VRLLVLPRYGRLGASSRLRSYQYLPWFQRAGIDAHVHSLLDDHYVRALYARQHAPIAVLKGYLERITWLLRSRHFDAVFIEKEALPWVPATIDLGMLPRHIPLVVDYDDAVFHRYDRHSRSLVRGLLGDKLDRVMRRANLVTVGNGYLGQRALAAGCRRVERVPTVIDLDRYPSSQRARTKGSEIVIGWIGSPSTAHYLQQVSEPLTQLCQRHRLRCVAIGARPDQLLGTPFTAVDWREETEVESLRTLDIGIMPLPDAPWERGKCGYKLIQYMACGLPVVASPVGVNADIVRHGQNGLLAENPEAWVNCLEWLITDADLRARMGALGRQSVETEYCLQVQGPRLARMLLELAVR
jgi:glycosyltransferase involved in cell wall biosynthesis